MECFIAYFDILGFKELVEKRSLNQVNEVLSELNLWSQNAIANNDLMHLNNGMAVPNLYKAEINCLHISDSIVFWSRDSSSSSLKKILDVCWDFYNKCFSVSCIGDGLKPLLLRGCLVKGEIEFHPYNFQNKNIFINSSIFGKGLIDAYSKAENQSWAGCFIDKSVVENNQEIIDELVNQVKILYTSIPLKDGERSDEYIIRFMKGKLPLDSYENYSASLENYFKVHLKNEEKLKPRVEEIFNNTKEFLKILTQ